MATPTIWVDIDKKNNQSNLGVIMDDPVYLMNDPVATMNDSKSDPNSINSTVYTQEGVQP